MEDENMVNDETSEVEAEKVVEEQVEEPNDESEEESVDTLKAELAKAKEVAKNQEIRAKKAEALAKNKAKASTEAQLSVKDSIALAKADIHVEDIDELISLAKYKKLSVSEALGDATVQAVLRERTELRKTSEATNVGGSRRAPKQSSGVDLLLQADKGNLPQNDSDIDKLIEARLDSRRKK